MADATKNGAGVAAEASSRPGDFARTRKCKCLAVRVSGYDNGYQAPRNGEHTQPLLIPHRSFAPVAQLDRASAF